VPVPYGELKLIKPSSIKPNHLQAKITAVPHIRTLTMDMVIDFFLLIRIPLSMPTVKVALKTTFKNTTPFVIVDAQKVNSLQ
jgi:hypothetical protein